MPSSLFAPGEIEEIHAQIAQLRAETMRLSKVKDKDHVVFAFDPEIHFWQTIAVASGLVVTVASITIGILTFFL